MRIKLITKPKYQELVDDIKNIENEIKENNNISLDNYPLIKEYKENTAFEFSEKDLIETEIDFDPSTIADKLNPLSDSETAEIIHRGFTNLEPIEASYKFFWSTLTHREFLPYVQKRWDLKKDTLSRIKNRWLFDQSDRNSFARNAISRLWWSAHLTYKPWEIEKSLEIFKDQDPYKYTKILTSSSQLIQDVLDRKWGSNLILRICFLEATKRIMEKRGLTITKLSKELSIVFRACLIPDIILISEKDPYALVEYIEEVVNYTNLIE